MSENPHAEDPHGEVDRICNVIAAQFEATGVKVITDSGKLAYLGKYSWAADTAAQATGARSVEVIKAALAHPWTYAYPVLYRFVDATCGTPQKYRAFLVFVRRPGVNERVVVVKAE